MTEPAAPALTDVTTLAGTAHADPLYPPDAPLIRVSAVQLSLVPTAGRALLRPQLSSWPGMQPARRVRRGRAGVLAQSCRGHAARPTRGFVRERRANKPCSLEPRIGAGHWLSCAIHASFVHW